MAAVWGQMCSGSGHARLKEIAAVLGIPTMTKKAFVATESAIDKCWWQSLDESMKEAAKEEHLRQTLTIARGNITLFHGLSFANLGKACNTSRHLSAF